MAIIRSISDLRNRAHEISEICHRSDEPVFITKNGREDLVVISHARYERERAMMELRDKLDESTRSSRRGDRGIGHNEMMRLIRKRIR